jgi:hypothetical protein
VAAAELYTALGEVELLTAATLVDVLDAVSWGLLTAAGVNPLEARAILAELWADR